MLILFRTVLISPVRGDRNKKKAAKRFYYIPFAMKTNIDPPSSKTYHGGRILMIGKYVQRKNHILLIKAVEQIQEKIPVTLTLIGSTNGKGLVENKDNITRYIHENKLMTFIEQKNVIPYHELQNEYRNYDMFVLPSRDEEVGVSVLEAMSHGLPVICSNTAGAADFIRNKKNGIVFKSDDLQSLTSAIEYCFYSPEHLISMGENSRKLVYKYHSPELYYCRMMILIKKILKQQ
jgi:glycosyltransferase involved in cell wall biosynthesis